MRQLPDIDLKKGDGYSPISLDETGDLHNELDEFKSPSSQEQGLDLPLHSSALSGPDDYVSHHEFLRQQAGGEERSVSTPNVVSVGSDFAPLRLVKSDNLEPKLDVQKDLDGMSDTDLRDEGLKAYLAGDVSSALGYFERVKNNKLIHITLDTLIRESLDSRNFAEARKFASLINDSEISNKYVEDIDEQEARFAPTPTGNLDQSDTDALNKNFGGPSVSNNINKANVVRGAIPAEPLTVIDTMKDEVISDDDYDKFTRTGEVSSDILNDIVQRIIKGEETTPRQHAVYEEKRNGDKIEALLREHIPVTPPTIPSAVDLAMKKTEGVVSEAVAPQQEAVPSTPVVEVRVESNDDLDANLERAREEYATLLTEWKKERREKSSKFAKMMSDLGSDKRLEDLDESKELLDARNSYNEAKRKKSQKLFEKIKVVPNQDQKPLGIQEALAQSDREAFFAEVEREINTLEAKVVEGMPAFYKPAVEKASKIWDKLPDSAKTIATNRWVRMTVSAALVSGVVVTFGLAGAGAGLASLTLGRATRAAVGGFASQPAAWVADKVSNKINLNKRKDFVEGIDVQFSPENLERTEKEIEDFLKGEKSRKNIQKVSKIGAMLATGGLTYAGLDSLVNGSVPSSGLIDNLNKPKVSPEVLNSGNKLENLEQFKPALNSEISSGAGTKVELSSLGFIKDLHNLKADILSEYHEGTIPELLKVKVMDKTPIELAKQFGFYDPEHNASAMGLKGESLSLDSSGNLFYERLNGTKQLIFDVKTGEIHPYTEELVSAPLPSSPVQNIENADASVDVPIHDPILNVDETELTDLSSGVKEIAVEEPIVLTNEENLNIKPSVSENESISSLKIPIANGKSVDVMDLGGQRVVTFEGLPIGHEEGGLLVLDEKFQDGTENAPVRGVFAKAFEATVKDSMGPRPIAESFEGGKIYVSFGVPTDPEKIRILLNGKEIAYGLIKNGVPKVEMLLELKRPWYLSDSVYERAFKHMDKLIKTGAFNFKI